MRRTVLFVALLLAALLLVPACIIVDDDDFHEDETELVTVENLTSVGEIDFYLDGRYEATLQPFGVFTLEGDFEGNRELYAESFDFIWGPDIITIRDGDHITWSLDLSVAELRAPGTPSRYGKPGAERPTR